MQKALEMFMNCYIFWETVKYSDYPSFVGLFPNKRNIPKFSYLSQNIQGQNARKKKKQRWKLSGLEERS